MQVEEDLVVHPDFQLEACALQRLQQLLPEEDESTPPTLHNTNTVMLRTRRLQYRKAKQTTTAQLHECEPHTSDPDPEAC